MTMKKNKDYDLIIFDWDGTLMDSESKIVNCFRKAAQDIEIDYPGDKAVRNIIGLGLKEALAVLMPIVASMGGNAGTQTMTVTVRALAMRELGPANIVRVVTRETAVGLINGFLFAMLINKEWQSSNKG